MTYCELSKIKLSTLSLSIRVWFIYSDHPVDLLIFTSVKVMDVYYEWPGTMNECSSQNVQLLRRVNVKTLQKLNIVHDLS